MQGAREGNISNSSDKLLCRKYDKGIMAEMTVAYIDNCGEKSEMMIMLDMQKRRDLTTSLTMRCVTCDGDVCVNDVWNANWLGTM